MSFINKLLVILGLCGGAQAEVKHVFLFDIHGVITKTDAADIYKTVIRSSHTWSTLGTILGHPIQFGNTLINARKAAFSEQRFEFLADQMPQFDKVREEFYALSNGHLQEETIQIIKELHAAGYHLYIASNAGPGTLKWLQEHYPDLMSLFTGIIVPTPENGFLAKPSKAYFAHARTTIDAQEGASSRIIFIDDSKANVQGAQQYLRATDKALLFTQPKVLRKELKSLGFLKK